MMKTEAIRALTTDELDDQLGQARRELFNLRVQKATRQLDQSLKLRIARRDLARLLTVRHERQGADQAESNL